MWHPPDPHRTDASPGRRRWRRTTGLAAIATAGVVVLAACGGGGGGSNGGNGGGGNGGGGNGGALSKFKSNGITIGIANEKPYDYKTGSGKVTGEAPSLAKVILGKLGITKLSYKVVDFDGLIPGLKSKRFDMTAGAASINPKRAKQVLYADPDYCVLEDLGVKKGNPKKLSDYKSIKKTGAKLAVESGATELKFAQQVGVPKKQLVIVSNNAALVESVKTGRADAFSLTGITVRDLVSSEPSLMALKGFNPVVNGKEQLSCGGFQFRKNEKELRDAFTKQLHKLQKANKVYSIVKKASPKGDAFGFSKDQFQEAKKHTAAELGKSTG
jgi:polar amino acid transport system substrate-binding protein